MLRESYRGAKRLAVFVLGTIVVLVGIALLVLPGPGMVLIFLGLTLLATEFAWARQWLQRLREKSLAAGRKARTWWRKRPTDGA
jgi:uncharacterized protein (TIGR02611 family)